MLHATAVHQNFLLNGFSFSNATGKPGLTAPSAQQAVAGVLSKGIGLSIWALTAICILCYRRNVSG